MEAELEETQSDGSPIPATSKKYGIPHSSLQFKLKNPSHKETCGPLPKLSSEKLTLVQCVNLHTQTYTCI